MESFGSNRYVGHVSACSFFEVPFAYSDFCPHGEGIPRDLAVQLSSNETHFWIGKFGYRSTRALFDDKHDVVFHGELAGSEVKMPLENGYVSASLRPRDMRLHDWILGGDPGDVESGSLITFN